MTTDDIRVRIQHPNGVVMRFTVNILEFLANRHNQADSFYFGLWLESLVDDEVEQLQFLAKQFMDGAEDKYLDDVMSVALHAITAEIGKPTLEFSPEYISSLIGLIYVHTSIELYRRRGWVVIESSLSIDPNKEVDFTLTPLGELEGKNTQSMFH